MGTAYLWEKSVLWSGVNIYQVMYFSTVLLHGGYSHFSDKETVLEFVFCGSDMSEALWFQVP